MNQYVHSNLQQTGCEEMALSAGLCADAEAIFPAFLSDSKKFRGQKTTEQLRVH